MRLKELHGAGLVVLSDTGYAATEQGREFYLLLRPLGDWSKEWARELAMAGHVVPGNASLAGGEVVASYLATGR
jgi:DNA-binding HxlR family transcriptional regulator